MKVIILNSELKEKHINLIKDTVKKVNADYLQTIDKW